MRRKREGRKERKKERKKKKKETKLPGREKPRGPGLRYGDGAAAAAPPIGRREMAAGRAARPVPPLGGARHGGPAPPPLAALPPPPPRPPARPAAAGRHERSRGRLRRGGGEAPCRSCVCEVSAGRRGGVGAPWAVRTGGGAPFAPRGCVGPAVRRGRACVPRSTCARVSLRSEDPLGSGSAAL